MEALPKPVEIFKKITQVSSYTKEDIVIVKDFIFTSVVNLKVELTKYIASADFKEDPEVFQDRLEYYADINGGLMALADAVHDRAFYFSYKDLLETKMVGTTKLTSADREVFAKGELADLRATRKDLEQMASNISGRLYRCRAYRR